MNNLYFNNEFIKKIIDKGLVLLKSPFLSLSKRKIIKKDITTLENLLINNFEKPNSKSGDFEESIEVLKKIFLQNMKKQYEALGEKLIVQLIELGKNLEFDSQIYIPNGPQFTIDDQIEEVLELYSNNSQLFSERAREIIFNNQIHVDYELNSNSWVYSSQILNAPLLIIDPSESSSILVVKLQKAIEMSLKLNPNFLFEDLGPLYFELLYNDQLFSKYKIFSESYHERATDFKFKLKQLESYLELLLSFSKSKFKVETDRFVGSVDAIRPFEYLDVINYLNDEVHTGKTQESIVYCVAYLKAIDLRQTALKSKTEALEELNLYLKGSNKKIGNINSIFASYEIFSDELKQKGKKNLK